VAALAELVGMAALAGVAELAEMVESKAKIDDIGRDQDGRQILRFLAQCGSKTKRIQMIKHLPAEDLAAPCVTLSYELKQSHFVCSVLKLGRWEYCAGN
jgi:hypothetical protein